jgi:bifunctional DNA-binding transcriptional regulator/antitoxin component of YhaV-PrlF toxin-antitoxin module
MIQSIVGTPSYNKKRISVSQKRQITIPLEFFKIVGIGHEVECFVQNNEIVIRPVREISGEFDEQILADLISHGYSGEELLEKFKEMRKKIRPAVESLISDAKQAAEGKGEYVTYKDVFGTEDK